ncbi:hypothetical protein [Parvularcula sp. LCG005]|uniref:hypothetical protein n=1 Tax=Parvularcula sp. LCG005 TaxID=3078805 RepID=UPI0029422163|nr:hypothetical protein [Parvularcula sp. LCG005]WOI52612.1 hypothetical protein RUI03_10685 [Parvularcula sp. LCG005]
MTSNLPSKVDDRIVFNRIAKEIDASAKMALQLQSVLGDQLQRLIDMGEVPSPELQEIDHLTQVLEAIADYMREVSEQLPGTQLDVSQALKAVPIRKLAQRLSECHSVLADESAKADEDESGAFELFG